MLNLFQGELKNYKSEEQNRIQDELLLFLKENGLTTSQAIHLLENTLDIISNYSFILTVDEYEKITGRKVSYSNCSE